MNLAFNFPIIYWNCACLISDAGGNEEEEEIEDMLLNEDEEVYYEELEDFNEEQDKINSSYEEDDSESGFPATIIVTSDGKKKKKIKTTNYGRIAAAIGKISSAGIKISNPDINYSEYSFSPNVDNNHINYGLNGITNVGPELVKKIIANRPYKSVEDFLQKVKVNKRQMINLIKSGAFDNLEESRILVMKQYVKLISDCKKRITLQNMKMLIDFNLIPNEYNFQCRVYNFNKYIKKLKLDNEYYALDNIAFSFFEENFDVDFLEIDNTESGFKIKQTKWDSIYKYNMDIIRPYIKKNNQLLLDEVNKRLINKTWNKYCLGSISKWEMDSISCYIHEHELKEISEEEKNIYEITDFCNVPKSPEIERYIPIKGKMIPIFKLYRICGVVLDKNKTKKTVTILTTDGVVNVKIYGVFSNYDKQISERGADGVKHVIRKSEFSRGNKIILTGICDDENTFRAKKYSRTPRHLIETIEDIDNGKIIINNRNDEV